MTQTTFSGFPRIGVQRELKRALEAHWRGEQSADALLDTARELRARHWKLAADAGIDSLPVNDFSLYDHMLDTIVLFDAIPERYRKLHEADPLAGYFAMARGHEKDGYDLRAMEMTKWFDTNYHYLVPELQAGQNFRLAGSKIIDEYKEASAAGYRARPVVPGPITFLTLAKTVDGSAPLDLLDKLLPAYAELLEQLADAGAEWVQLDEPCLAGDLDEAARNAFRKAWQKLAEGKRPKLLLANYFGAFGDNLALLKDLPVDGVQADLVRGARELDALLDVLPATAVLGAGVVDGRNVWRSRPNKVQPLLDKIVAKLGAERLWVSPSCSLLHVPVDLEAETKLDAGLRGSLAFAKQKLEELRVYADAADGNTEAKAALEAQQSLLEARAGAEGVVRQDVRDRLEKLRSQGVSQRSEYPDRVKAQQQALPLPDLPTTTIGSFPQTPELRKARADRRHGRIDDKAYDDIMRAEIERCIRFQEKIGLDVLVHGEAERNDMVEYFGERLDGYAFTENGWVQSYGSRCVKPPLIYGDVARPEPMTVDWLKWTQSLTDKPVKGMLTGPVTMLKWSFVRNDLPAETVCRQISLALRDEVVDLEKAGIHIIQVDEAAFRECMPLQKADWDAWLAWAVECFRISTGGVADSTRIQSHMCYSEFNGIMEAIEAMDADAIFIECSRSRMELLDAFVKYKYPNEIGPGVYDIHSPRVPEVEEMVDLLDKALEVLDPKQLWINPDCGLKTRKWDEVEPALTRLVEAAGEIRQKIGPVSA